MRENVRTIFRHIIILCLALAGVISPAFSQSKSTTEVKGVVYDEVGEPLPGASVIVTSKRERWGCQTNIDGEFVVKVPSDVLETSKLEMTVSFVGFSKYVVTLKKEKKDYKVKLKLDDNQIEEVLVTGYQQVDRRKTASSISSVIMDEVLTPAMTTIDQALEGRIPDLMYLQNSGDVGATARLRVRGTSTLLGSREPLWVLDGFVIQDPVEVEPEKLNDPDFVNYIGNAIQGLNPQDIERIDVLKDAAATALYGTKASNGVIVITTKKGKVGPPRISYSNQSKLVIRPRYSDKAVNLMTSRERVQFGKDLTDIHYSFPSNMPLVGYEGAFYRYQTKQTSYEEYLKEAKYYERVNTDWFDILTDDALTNAHTISLSGGTDKTRYYASVGYTNENGVKKTEYVDRYTASINFNTKITEELRLNMRVNGNVQKKNHLPGAVNPLDYAYNTTRALPAYNEDGTLYYYQNKGYGIGHQSKNTNKYRYNILNEMENSSSEYSGNTMMTNMELNYNLKNILTLSSSFSYSRSSTQQSLWFGEKTNYVAILKNGEVEDKPIGGYSGASELPFGGILNTTNSINENFTGRLNANFRYTLKSDKHYHLFTAGFGYEIGTTRSNSIKDDTRGFFKDRGLQYVKMNKEQLDEFPLYKEWLAEGHRKITQGKTNTIGSWLTLSYDLDNYFTFSLNGRFDASNKFGSRSNERLLPLWSTAIRVNLKDIFVAKVKKINELTFRGSFGKTGNMLDGETPNLLIRQGTFDAFYGENTSQVHRLPNPNLKWEVATNTNFGISMSAFDNRLSVNTEVWTKYVRDAFAAINVSTINGVKSYNMNNGDISNYGYSITLSGYPIRTKDWRLYLSTMYSWVSNKVQTKTSDIYKYTDYLNGTAIIDGKPIGTFYSYGFLGLNPNNGTPVFDDYIDKRHLLMGKNVSEIIPMVMVESGSREPKLQGSVYANLSWKQLSLNMNFNYSIGSKIRLFPLYKPIMEGISSDKNVRKEILDRWRKPGDEKRTVIPSLLSQTDADYGQYYSHWSLYEESNGIRNFAQNVWSMYDLSDIRVVPGDYLRLSSLTLSYNLNSKQLKKTPFQSFRVSLNATNVFTIASKKLVGQDPSQANNEKAVLSIRPAYTLGLNVSF